MASNSFGDLFCITTWGESHGKAVGVVVDGCPPGLSLSEQDIAQELLKRAPGNSPFTSPRKELDTPEILSGVFNGKTTGAPISIMIQNRDADSSKYEPIKAVLRPGHAQYTYLQKYGVFDYRGGGRASARETVCRVAAGAIAKKILAIESVFISGFIQQIGHVKIDAVDTSQLFLKNQNYNQNRNRNDKGLNLKSFKNLKSVISCPDPVKEKEMICCLEKTIEEGNSVGGVVGFVVEGVPAGWGDPVYAKLEANLASALMSLPASKGFEIGEGFASLNYKGAEFQDSFSYKEKEFFTESNRSGGILGGISTGNILEGKVAFKPTSSTKDPQKTVDLEGREVELRLPIGSRHDPCVAIRAVPVVEAMVALVLVDAFLKNKSCTIG